jgi:hypothetical protein
MSALPDRILTPAHGPDLRAWAERDWSDGLELAAVQELDRFVVQTRNTAYDITVLSVVAGAVLVRGGRYFPDHTRAVLAGCSLGGSVLKLRAIHPGFTMELLHDGRRIVTTGVRSITPVVPASA